MTVLTGAITDLVISEIVNPLITADLDSYAVDIWPPHASLESSPKSGTLTRTLPVSANARSLTGAVTKSFFHDYYNRIHITPVVLNFGNVIEQASQSIYIWNAYLLSTGLINYITTDPLLSVSPSFTTLTALQELHAYVIAMPGGIDNLDDTITFNWGTSEASTISILGTRVAILPYQARTQWQEIHEWYTNVIKSYDGTEQRRKIRANPRLTLEVEYPVPPTDRQRAQNLTQGWVGHGWVVPLWADAAYGSALSAGAMSVTVTNSDTVLQYASECVLWQDHLTYELVKIASIVGTTVTFVEPTVNAYSRPIVLPVANAVANQGIVRNTDGYRSDIKASYRVSSKPEIPEVVPAQYKGEDIYYSEQILPNNGMIPDDMLTRIDEVTNRVANSKFYAPWVNTQQSRIYTVDNRTKAETLAFKKWLARRSGKFRPFWTPSFENDFTLTTTGYIINSFSCIDNGYTLYQTKRNHIAILKTDGTWIPCEILSYSSPVGGVFSLTLDTNLNFNADQIKQVCYLGLKRLDTDRIEIYFPGNSRSYASLRIVEIEP